MAIEEKTVLKPAVAQQRAASNPAWSATEPPKNLVTENEAAADADKAPTDAAAPKRYKFVKLYGVAQELVFKDGTTFTFRLIMRNDGTGYSGSSLEVTTDETLAKNLRELSKIPEYGIREVD